LQIRTSAGRLPGKETWEAGDFRKLAPQVFLLAKTYKMRKRPKIAGRGASFNITNPLLIKRQGFLSQFMLFFTRYATLGNDTYAEEIKQASRDEQSQYILSNFAMRGTHLTPLLQCAYDAVRG
jgi:hypothetical protein